MYRKEKTHSETPMGFEGSMSIVWDFIEPG